MCIRDRLQPLQMIAIQWEITANRKPNAMQRDRIVNADGREVSMWSTAAAHIILCMDLEEPDIRLCSQNIAIVLGLQSEAAAIG